MEENKPETAGIIRNPDGTFAKGCSGNPLGKPPGLYSPITRVKQIFAENPEKFEAFVKSYMESESNSKHVVEMIDGKPQLDITSKGKSITVVVPQAVAESFNINGTNTETEGSNTEQSEIQSS